MKIGCSTPETTFEDETWRLKVKFTLQSISVVALHLRLQYIHAFGRYFSWLLKRNNRSDLCIFHSLCRQDDLFTEKQQYYEEHSSILANIVKCLKTSWWCICLLQKYSFSLHKSLIDGLESCTLLVDYCDVFISCLDSFWRHPFTAEDPLVSKSCDANFLQICSDVETNSSTSWMA